MHKVRHNCAQHNTGNSPPVHNLLGSFPFKVFFPVAEIAYYQDYTHRRQGAVKHRITYVRFWNYTAGHGDARNLYVTDLAVNGSNPYLSPELAQTLTVVRPGAPEPVVITPTAATVSTDPDTGLPVLTATLSADAPAALADSIWYAVTLDPETRSWNWTNIPSSSVTLSGPTVTIRCPDLPTAIFSLGAPGTP